jgi:hypothetical protein
MAGLSSMLALIFFAGVTAESAMAAGRAMLRGTPPACEARDGEITVCGRRDEGARQRLPFPQEREPSNAPRIATGERPMADAGPVRQAACGVMDRGQVCGGGMSAAAVIGAVARIVETLVHPDGIAEPADFHERPDATKAHPATPLAPR